MNVEQIEQSDIEHMLNSSSKILLGAATNKAMEIFVTFVLLGAIQIADPTI